MSENTPSLLRFIVKNYGRLSAADVLRMTAEELNPADPEDQIEYNLRAMNGTLKPLVIHLSSEAKALQEKNLVQERLDRITRNSIATPQPPGFRNVDPLAIVDKTVHDPTKKVR